MAKKKVLKERTKNILIFIGIILAIIIVGSILIPAIKTTTEPNDVIINEENKDFIFDETGTNTGVTNEKENNEDQGQTKSIKADNFKQRTSIKNEDLIFTVNDNNLTFFRCELDGLEVYGISFNYQDSETSRITMFENYEVNETKFPMTAAVMIQTELSGETAIHSSMSESVLTDFNVSQTIYFESNGIDYRFTISNIHKFLQNTLLKYTNEYSMNSEKNAVAYTFNLNLDGVQVYKKVTNSNWELTDISRVIIPISYINVESQYMYNVYLSYTSAGCEVYL